MPAEIPADIPGPMHSPSANLVITDVAIRLGSHLMRRAIERGMLKERYGDKKARAIIRKRSIAQTLAISAIARLGTGSWPGAVIVTTGMAAKILLDRSRHRHEAQAEGDAQLLDQAQDE